MHKNSKGAGFLVFRNFDGEKKVLILVDRLKRFDIPKGHVDVTDSNAFATAQRECFEETQILVSDCDLITNDFYQDENLTIFCVQTKQSPILDKNPTTGEFEHLHFLWLSPDTAAVLLPTYLSDALVWGLKYID